MNRIAEKINYEMRERREKILEGQAPSCPGWGAKQQGMNLELREGGRVLL
jgi:hypothetical protein